MLITLERAYLPHCTIGQLHVPGEHMRTYATIERPWLNNRRNVSCIPEGAYDCVPHNGTKFKGVWRLEDVPDRSAILIHAGNYANNVEGCIAVAKLLSEKSYKIISSEAAINELREILPDEFQIRITTWRPQYP